MTHTNITSFRKDIYNLLEQTIKYNEPINITTKNGNAIVLSEEDYNNIMETLYISSKRNCFIFLTILIIPILHSPI